MKTLASTAVCSEEHDGKELYDFLIYRCILHKNVSMLQEKQWVIDRQFFFIKKEMESFRNDLEKNQFKTYRGTCKLH